MQSRHKWHVPLSISLGMLLLLTLLGVLQSEAQGVDNPRPLTTGGRSRFAGWSPDSHTVLVNRWGAVAGDGPTRQVLNELWAISLPPMRGKGRGWEFRLSENAAQPAYSADGQRLAYLAFAGNGRWEARVLDLVSGQEETWATADWRTPPTWIGGRLAFVQGGQVQPAWSDGAHLWALPQQGGERRLLAAPPRSLPTLGEKWERGANAQVLDFVWSPDGQRLAYVVVDDDLSPALWVADVAGEGAPVLLAQGQMEVFSTPSWSPDGRTLAFSRAPLGAETAPASDIWLVNADGTNLRPLLRNDLEESNPAWSPDGRYLAFNRAGDVWVLDLARPLPAARSPHEEHGHKDPFTNLPVYQSTTNQQTPPATIRVIHHAANYYRDVPEGQIDVIPFEDYVKRCVPVEMSASWPSEPLKVQAMAARTYAWYNTIARANEDWDVSDWTDYQVMGREDQRDPRSDQATDDTQGQYIAYQGDVIKSFYSAENGSPTSSAAGYDYIQAVDDPVSFGQERWGHGWGMSQWGTRRWAEWHGWGYQQILAHYYTGVTIELPSNGGPTPTGGVTLPWSGFFVTSNRVYITANASDEASDVSAVGFYATADTTTLLVTDTVGSDGWSTVWDVTALDDTAATTITLSLLIADGEGHVQSQAQTAHIGLDRQPPADGTATIAGAFTDTITVTLSSLSATDPSPGSTVQTMAFSNEGWTWEGEDLHHQSGEEVNDGDALNGKAWRGLAGTHSAGVWYGPYTYDLSPGHAYRAIFRLKTNDALTTAEVAMLDVVDSGGTRLLGLRRLRGTDFCAANTYQEFAVDFDYADAGTAGLEFRTTFRATADLYLDRVLIVSYPVSLAPSIQWRLPPGEGLKTVTVKFTDGAGNVSADLTRTVTLSDTSPPTGWRDYACQYGGSTLTCTVRVLDEISGLNVDSASYRLSTDGGASWGDWVAAACTGISATAELQTITASGVPIAPSETGNLIEFQIADVKGYTSTAVYTVYNRFLYLPLVTKE